MTFLLHTPGAAGPLPASQPTSEWWVMLTAGVAMTGVEDLSPALFLGQYSPSLTPGK